MLLTSKGRYAVMAMVDIAMNDGDGAVNLCEIARRQGIDAGYLEQIFVKLKKVGLVESFRGPGGGYKLARKCCDITVSDIMYAVEESMKITRCEMHSATGCIPDKSRCVTHDLWEELGAVIYRYLRSVNLEDITQRKVIR